MRSGEFLAGLLDPSAPAFVTAEDTDGPHGPAIRTWQREGFIGRDPGLHPSPSCPHCTEGVPYRAEGRLVCSGCRSGLDPRQLLAWSVHREAFLAALARHISLKGGVRLIGPDLWDLGAGMVDGAPTACVYHPCGSPSSVAQQWLSARLRVLVLHGPTPLDPTVAGRRHPLADLLAEDGAFAHVSLADLVRERGPVLFDPATGVLRIGGHTVGEVPLGSREWAFLACLHEHLDQYVPYVELKREVLVRRGGSGDADEATFCQKLKSRVKQRYLPGIDRLVVATNKGDGYRLRGEAG